MSDPMHVDDPPQLTPAHPEEEVSAAAHEVEVPMPRNEERRTVHFHDEISIHYISHGDVAPHELYYSFEEMAASRLRQRRDVAAAYRRHGTAQSSSTPSLDEDEGECDVTGIENVCTPHLARKLSARRRGCVDAVLDEQERQDELGGCDAEELARASRRFSGYASERAQKIGALHRLGCASPGSGDGVAAEGASQAMPTRRSSMSATEVLASNRLAPRMLTHLSGLV